MAEDIKTLDDLKSAVSGTEAAVAEAPSSANPSATIWAVPMPPANARMRLPASG